MAPTRLTVGFKVGCCGNLTQGQASPFACTSKTQVAETVRQLVHTKWIFVHLYVVVGDSLKEQYDGN